MNKRKDPDMAQKRQVIDEYLLHYGKNEIPPTFPQMRNDGKGGLVNRISKVLGGLINLRKELDIVVDRRPPDYWTLTNTVTELRQFISEHPELQSHFPVQALTDNDKEKLKRAIYMHGGLKKLNARFKLGLKISHEPWSKRKLLRELKELTEKGIVIDQKTLKQLNRSDLLGAMKKFGGMNSWKRKLGLPIKRQHYWSEEKIITQLQPIVKKFGRIPSEPIFKCLGKNDLLRACMKRGGFRKFSALLQTTSTGYYKSNDGHYLQSGYECLFDNILFKYGIRHEVHGKISPLHKYRFDFLINNVHIEICGYSEKEHTKYHQRLKQKQLLYDQLNVKYLFINKEVFNDKLSKVETNILKILRDIIPSKKDFSVVTGADLAIVPTSYWADLENIRKELLPLIKKYKRFPLDHELRKEGKFALITGIYKYHGSFYELGKKLKIDVQYKPKGYYTEVNAKNDYEQLCAKAGEWLSLGDLQNKKVFGLAAFIAKNGGFHEFRKLIDLDFPHKRIPNHYYTLLTAGAEYEKLCQQEGKHIPPRKLRQLGFGSLATFIEKNGGYIEIRKRIGLIP